MSDSLRCCLGCRRIIDTNEPAAHEVDCAFCDREAGPTERWSETRFRACMRCGVFIPDLLSERILHEVDCEAGGKTKLSTPLPDTLKRPVGRRKKSRFKGLHAYRLKQNPEERRFAKAWADEHVLEWLLGDGTKRVDLSEREEEVAATVVQWLGSPVGQHFLGALGYEKRKGRKSNDE